ncbi:Ig-like domain-containing protein [Candidatus Pantoea persica]|uniref:Ig-like domain-containing protein n=1 Tax=Candidatus Pantoea persica TaxID=2518128 RepID=UPI00215D616F|nr:Ig-like domain-containing protein [Candidatus Pantoea persica]MBA2816237.1 Ig-like domain repeat protein [Candidatus Pantoea persica]
MGADGNWIFTLPMLAERSYSLTTVVTDAAGNVGLTSDAFNFSVDTSAPALADNVLVNSNAGQTLTPIADGATTNKATAELGSIITVYDGQTLLGSVAAGADGTWSFTPAALSNGGAQPDRAPDRRSGQRQRHDHGECDGLQRGADGGNAIGSFSLALTTAQTTGASLSVTQVDRAGNVSPASTVLGAIRVAAANGLSELNYSPQTRTITNANTSTSGVALLNASATSSRRTAAGQ